MHVTHCGPLTDMQQVQMRRPSRTLPPTVGSGYTRQHGGTHLLLSTSRAVRETLAKVTAEALGAVPTAAKLLLMAARLRRYSSMNLLILPLSASLLCRAMGRVEVVMGISSSAVCMLVWRGMLVVCEQQWRCGL